MNGEFLDIILFGVVAVFLIMRLKNILGKEQGKIINIKTKQSVPNKNISKKPKTKADEEEDFLNGAGEAFSMIVNAYQENALNKVAQLLTDDAFKILSENKAPSHIKFMTVISSKVISSDVTDNKIVKTVDFKSEHYDVKLNDQITVEEEWGFEKEKNSNDPNWKLFAIKVVK